MKSKFVTLLSTVFLFSTSVFSQQIDTISVFSSKMNTEVKNVIILPENYDKGKQYPVLYLLHGYSGNHASWLLLKPSLSKEATRLEMIIVCPDGKNSWYWDSPMNPKSQYETYMSMELVNYIDKNYSTIKSREGRAIAGLSMGGHGAMWLAIRHQDVFGACGSMSGGLDIRPYPNNWEMNKLIGSYKDNPSVWDAHTVINQISKLDANSLAIMIDCGKGDFFYKVNEKFHEALLYNNIPHDYIIRPGNHDGKYWKNAIEYQLLFFHNFFYNKQGV